jgi:O-antigen/teichoic acid export membrane protein
MTPAAGRPAGGSRRLQLSMTRNSLALIGSKVAQMGLGFLFWLLAARLFAKGEVGLAAGVVSAMMLCTQIAALGIGSAVISHFPRHQDKPARLLDTSLSLTAVAATLAALAFIGLASGLFAELDAVGGSVMYALLFVLAAVTGTLGIIQDQTSTVLRRGDQALGRGIAFGIVTVVLLGAIAIVSPDAGSEALLIPWVVAGVVSVGIGVVQLHRCVEGYRARTGLDRTLSRDLLRTGLPNWALTLAERAPGLVLPVVVTEVLSPSANATWYTAWMMAWVVFIVPIQVGMTLFAEISHDPGSLERSVRRGVRASLGFGVPAAAALALVAGPLLSILGDAYSSSGAAPLRILVIAILPLTFVQVYYASCRGTGRLREAIVTGWVAGAASVAAATAAGAASGLQAMALAWVGVQVLASGWAALRLWRHRAAARATAGEPAAAGRPANPMVTATAS